MKRLSCFKCKNPKPGTSEDKRPSAEPRLLPSTSSKAEDPPSNKNQGPQSNQSNKQQPPDIDFSGELKVTCVECGGAKMNLNAKLCDPCQKIANEKREAARLQSQSQPKQQQTELTPSPTKAQLSKQQEQFEQMFSNWEKQFEDWKFHNRNNPDQGYVRDYIGKMNAMRERLLERRRNLQPKVEQQIQGMN